MAKVPIEIGRIMACLKAAGDLLEAAVIEWGENMDSSPDVVRNDLQAMMSQWNALRNRPITGVMTPHKMLPYAEGLLDPLRSILGRRHAGQMEDLSPAFLEWVDKAHELIQQARLEVDGQE